MTPVTLRAAIAALGFNQCSASRAIGITPRYMRRMLKGDWPISKRVNDWVVRTANRQARELAKQTDKAAWAELAEQLPELLKGRAK